MYLCFLIFIYIKSNYNLTGFPLTAFDRLCLTLCPKFNLKNCENLSVEALSKHNCCLYLGTYHFLLLCDNRSPKHCVR